MAVSLKHTTQAVGTDAGNGEIGKMQWNEEHTLTMATGKLLGRSTAGTGAAEEITVGTGLSLSGGSLTAAGTVGGSDTQVQFNDSSAFGGDAGLTYNKTTNALTIGAGSLNFTGSTSGTVTIQPAAAAGTYALTLPTGTGTNGQALLTDGTGVLSWGAVGGTPGGSNTQLQYNNSGVFAGASGLTTNGTELTIASGTKTADAPLLNASQTWNNAAVTFTGLKLNVTDTASATASFLMNLQVGGSNRFSVLKSGSTLVPDGEGYFNLNKNQYGLGFSASNGNTNIYCNGNVIGLFKWSSSANVSGLYIFADSYSLFFGTNGDAILSRRAAANLRLGAADVAAPVAQTLSVQSVVAGTTNTAGANFTITGSQGTGTGAGGSIIFQVAPAGSSGTAQNALADALTIAGDRTVSLVGLLRGASQFYPAIDLGGTAGGNPVGMGFYFGSSSFSPGSVLGAFLANDYAGTIAGLYVCDTFGFATRSSRTAANTPDIRLYRDAAGTLAQRNGANAQESRVYASYTAADNYQRMSIKTLRESSGALSGASYTTTIAIPAYAHLIGVTTRVTTAITGATSYSVGDGSDVDLWGGTIGIALGSQSRTADFTAVGAVGATAAARNVTLTANGSNFTGGVVEICLHYLTTEAD